MGGTSCNESFDNFSTWANYSDAYSRYYAFNNLLFLFCKIQAETHVSYILCHFEFISEIHVQYSSCDSSKYIWNAQLQNGKRNDSYYLSNSNLASDYGYGNTSVFGARERHTEKG